MGRETSPAAEAAEELGELPLRVLQLLEVGGVDFLLLHQRGQQLGLLPAVRVEGGAGPRQVGAQQRRLLGPGRQLRSRDLQRLQVGAETRDALLVAAGQGAHEPVAADRVGRPLDGQQQAQVGQLAQLVQGAGAGGEGGTRRGEVRLQLPEPPAALLDLLVGPLQDDLRLAELLAAQPHLELEALDVAQQALLLAAELRQVAGEGVLARADPLQPRVAVAAGLGGGEGGRGDSAAAAHHPFLTSGACRRDRRERALPASSGWWGPGP